MTATRINKLKNAEIEEAILSAMNSYTKSVKLLIPFGKQNPLEMNKEKARRYVNAQRKLTKAFFKIEELARTYPRTFRKLTHTFNAE